MKKQETRTKINDKHQSRVSMTFRGQKTTSTQKSLISQWPANSETAIRGQNMPSSVKRGPGRFNLDRSPLPQIGVEPACPLHAQSPGSSFWLCA